MKSLPISLTISMLADEHGVSEVTWELLCTWIDARFSPEITSAIMNSVDATDGRFYLTEDNKIHLERTLSDLVRELLIQEL